MNHSAMVASRNEFTSDFAIEFIDVWEKFGDQAIDAMQAIQWKNLSKNEVLARFGCVVGVQNISFSVLEGEIFCIMGLSGSGKSTLAR